MTGAVSRFRLSRAHRLLLRGAGVLLALAGLGFYLDRLIAHGHAISWPDGGTAVFVLASLVVLQTFIYVMVSVPWYRLLRRGGVPLSFRGATALRAVSAPAKYIPGGIAHHLGRAALARSLGLPLNPVARAMSAEMMIMLAATGIIALAGLATIPGAIAGLPVWPFVIGTALLLAVACALAAVGWLPLPTRDTLTATTVAETVALVLWYGIVFATASIILFGAVNWVFDGEVGLWPCIAVRGIAMTATLLLPGLPAGLGIREAVLVAGLDPVGESAAVAAGILVHRLITVAADGAFALLGLGWLAAFRRGHAAL